MLTKVSGDDYDLLITLLSVVWYTAMLGKKSSLKVVLKLLKAEGVKNVRTTRFDPVSTSRAAAAAAAADLNFIAGWHTC